MKNIEKIKLSVCNAINSLPEEDLRQLIIISGEIGIPSIRAVYGCDECEKTFGDCDDYGWDCPCSERFREYCNMETAESENESL